MLQVSPLTCDVLHAGKTAPPKKPQEASKQKQQKKPAAAAGKAAAAPKSAGKVRSVQVGDGFLAGVTHATT